MVVVVGVLVGLAVALAAVGEPASGTIDFELRKLMIQFVLIVALGAVVTFVVDVAKRRMDRAARDWQYEVDTLTSLLARLDELYRKIKRERRSLEVVRISEMTYKEYEAVMWRLSDMKQDLERIWRDMEVLDDWLPNLKDVWSVVREMEDYLKPLEKEWRAVAAAPKDVFNAQHLTELSKFWEKTDSGKSNFYEFWELYYEARKALIKSLSMLRTAPEGERGGGGDRRLVV